MENTGKFTKKAMTFTRKYKLQVQVRRLKLYSAYMDYTPKCRYLGVILDHRLNWNE